MQKEQIMQKVQGLFDQGVIDGFVALKEAEGHIGPHIFQKDEDLASLSLGDRHRPGDVRYPLATVVARAAEMSPGKVFAVLVRGCDERALDQIVLESRVTPLRPDRFVPIGFSCPPELAESCRCEKPWPDALVAGEPTPGVEHYEGRGADDDLMSQLEFWLETMNRCVKCFGCRNVCPVCRCHECTIEQEVMVPQRELPPSPNFLMTRAMHMVDRCVYCGLCEDACPANIPLKDLYRFVARTVGQRGVIPGVRPFSGSSPTEAAATSTRNFPSEVH